MRDRIRRGDLVWRTHDPDLDKAARVYTEATSPLRKQAVKLRVTAHEGEPLRTVWTVGAVSVTADSDAPLGAAQNRAIDEEYLRAQFGRLGNTPYELAEVELEIAGAPFAPSSLLNQLRRDAVEQLQAAQGGSRDRRSASRRGRLRRAAEAATVKATVCPTLASAGAHAGAARCGASNCGRRRITLDYLDLYGLRPSVERVREPASPRASPARACSSRAKRGSSISCWAAIARFWCAPAACCRRCAIASRAN